MASGGGDGRRYSQGRPGGAGGGRFAHVPQNCTFRIGVPPNMMIVRGPGGQIQMIPRAQGPPIPIHIHPDQVQTSVSSPVLQQLQAQRRERMEREEHLREKKAQENAQAKEKQDKLKSKLSFSQAPQVELEEGELTARLSWDKKELVLPEDSKEVFYTVLAYTDDKPTGRKAYSGPDSSCELGQDTLLLGHTHHFTVSASLGDTSGDPSPKASITLPARAPAQPLPPKVATRGKNSLTLRWNAPQDNGAPISSYELEWDQGRGAWQQLACDKAKQFKLTQKLPPASVAQFRVRASNSVGDRLAPTQ